MPLKSGGGIRSIGEPVRLFAFEKAVSLASAVVYSNAVGLDIEPFMESLILAQNERWRRA